MRVAHYPAYCSKFNPIDRRLFSHPTRACQAVLFDSLQTIKALMEKTSTRTGDADGGLTDDEIERLVGSLRSCESHAADRALLSAVSYQSL